MAEYWKNGAKTSKPDGNIPPDAAGFEVNPTLWGYVMFSEYDHEPPVGLISLIR